MAADISNMGITMMPPAFLAIGMASLPVAMAMAAFSLVAFLDRLDRAWRTRIRRQARKDEKSNIKKMRTNNYLLCLATLSLPLSAQAQGMTVGMTIEKVTQMIFPSPIKTVKGGFLPDDFVMEIQENVLYIQPIASFSESNLNVVTTDNVYYTFTIRHDEKVLDLNHIIATGQALFGAGPKDAPATGGKPGEDRKAPGEDDTGIQGRILADGDNLFSGMAVRYKTTYMHLKGIYVKDEKLYVRLLFENLSNIKYDFEYVGFYIKERKQRKNSTQEQIQLTPESVYQESNTIMPRGTIEMVYSFPKFTIGKEKLLLIDMIEKGGERNLSLKVSDSAILRAKAL